MESEESRKVLAPAAGIAWCVTVLVTYYVFSLSYYTEKISVFGAFFVDLLK
jgi:hypothetical protein